MRFRFDFLYRIWCRFHFDFCAPAFRVEDINSSALGMIDSWRYKLLHSWHDRTHGVVKPILWPPAPIAGLSRAILYRSWVALAPKNLDIDSVQYSFKNYYLDLDNHHITTRDEEWVPWMGRTGTWCCFATLLCSVALAGHLSQCWYVDTSTHIILIFNFN